MRRENKKENGVSTVEKKEAMAMVICWEKFLEKLHEREREKVRI